MPRAAPALLDDGIDGDGLFLRQERKRASQHEQSAAEGHLL